MLSRRHVTMSLASTALIGIAAARIGRAAGAADSATCSRLSQIVREYDAQGIHRTATLVDTDSASWLAQALKDRGLRPELEPFRISRIDPGDIDLEIGGRHLGGVPLFDAGYTTTDGISGQLGGGIGIIAAPPTADTARPGPLRDALDGRSQALVIVSKGGREGLSLINAARFLAPQGVPALQVSSVEGDWLRGRAAAGASARLVCTVQRHSADALNVVATIPGRNAAMPPLVVMTPRSGWWHCAGERGGGIAIWLEMARAIVAAGPTRTVHFLASSGHELGQIGLDAYLARRPSLATDAALWVHFGANIGAGPHIRLQAADSGIQAQASAALAAHGLSVSDLVPPGTAPGGEAGTIFRRHGRYVSLQGDNPLFHNPADRWPEAIDIPYAARQAAAFQDLVLRLVV